MTEDETLYALAPAALPNLRLRRYLGDDLCLPITAFTAEDARLLRTIYDFLQRMVAALTPVENLPPPLAPIEQLLREHSPDEITKTARVFGHASYAADPTPMLAKTIHDLRGGGLTPLLAQLHFAERVGLANTPLKLLFYLTRDHLKIMRNAVVGLDDTARERDLLLRLHDTGMIVQKWHGSRVQAKNGELRLEVSCRQHTAISQCCVEFGALDRVLYNLINNACRHATGEAVRLFLFPIPNAEGACLRFILLNEVAPADLAYLGGRELSTLFDEGNSTTGSGYGLAIATQFVSHAFGLPNEATAIAEGYVGARLLGNCFAVWFHWPRVA